LCFGGSDDINAKTDLQNKIKRKVKPLAWESYDINETLELLYGKDRVYEKSEDIDIKLATNTEEYFETSMGPGYMNIRSNKKVKSITILQDKEADRALVALYYPYGNTVKIRLPLKILYAMLTMGIEGMRVVVIIETEDKYLFMNEYIIKYDYFCTQFDAMDMYLDDLRKDLNKNGFKTKYQIDENRVGYLKFQIFNPMLNYAEAEKFNVNINFVSHIEGHIKDKKLFDLYTSEYISKDPLIKMEFENMKQGESIDFSYSTINGEVTSKEVKPKMSKKKE
jgi:hypothetical protein